MRVTTTKSKNSESFYITKSFKNSKGKSTSATVRKLGVLNELLKEHGPTRDDVMAWAREEARLETEKYKKEQADCCKNSSFLYNRDSRILYYDCSNFYFEIEQEDGKKKYGKSKEHRPNPIVQMGLFMDRDGEKADIKYYLDEDKIANEEILTTLKAMNFTSIEGQGFMPLYRRLKLTDTLHDISGFNTDYHFITKRKMKEIQKISKRR